MTYRYFFMIIEEVEMKFKMMRLRGGMSGGLRSSFINIGKTIGCLFLESIERGERIYGFLFIRGFDGKIHSETEDKIDFFDIIPPLAGISVLLIIYFVF